MVWSKETEDALDEWVGRSTYHKEHPTDETYFSVFLASVWNDEHEVWDESEAEERIAQAVIRLHPKFGRDGTREEVKSLVREGTAALKFLSYIQGAGRFALLSPNPPPSSC